MMRAVQLTRSQEEFMYEAQRFLASDGEESLLSEKDDDDTHLFLRSSSGDRRGASHCRDNCGPEPHPSSHAIDNRMNDRAWAIAFAANIVVTVVSVSDTRAHAPRGRGVNLTLLL